MLSAKVLQLSLDEKHSLTWVCLVVSLKAKISLIYNTRKWYTIHSFCLNACCFFLLENLEFCNPVKCLFSLVNIPHCCYISLLGFSGDKSSKERKWINKQLKALSVQKHCSILIWIIENWNTLFGYISHMKNFACKSKACYSLPFYWTFSLLIFYLLSVPAKEHAYVLFKNKDNSSCT